MGKQADAHAVIDVLENGGRKERPTPSQRAGSTRVPEGTACCSALSSPIAVPSPNNGGTWRTPGSGETSDRVGHRQVEEAFEVLFVDAEQGPLRWGARRRIQSRWL